MRFTSFIINQGPTALSTIDSNGSESKVECSYQKKRFPQFIVVLTSKYYVPLNILQLPHGNIPIREKFVIF